MNRFIIRIQQSFERLPLSLKLISGVLSLLVPSVVIAVGALLSVLQSSVTTQIGGNMHTLAHSAANNVSNQISSEVHSLQILALSQTIVSDIEGVNKSYGDTEAFARERIKLLNNNWLNAQAGSPLRTIGQNISSSAALLQFANADPTNFNIVTTDRYGAAVAYTASPDQFDLSSEVWYIIAYNDGVGNTYISAPAYDPIQGYYITIAVPIFRQPCCGVAGVLHTKYLLKPLAKQIEEVQSDNSKIESYLVNFDGTRLDTTAGADIKVPESELPHLNLHAETADNETNWHVGTYGFDPSIIAHAPVIINEDLKTNINWTVIVRQNLETSLGPIQSLVRTAIYLSLIGLVVVVIFTVVVAQRLTQPIVELTKIANNAERGNLDVSSSIQGEDEIGQLASAFNSMIKKIRGATESLEQKVSERTEQLAAINDIAATVSTTLDISDVLKRTVSLIRDRLGYYQVSIFLLDEQNKFAIIRESTGEAGQKMKERGHRLEVGSQSIIGYVTSQRKARVALDVSADNTYFNNPLLPNTRSEIALPLIVGDSLLGALDVQSTERNAFDENDVAVLQNMANQIAVAINNARLFEEAQTQLEDIKHINQQYLAESWNEYARTKPDAVQFKFENGRVEATQDIYSDNDIKLSTPYLSDDGITLSIPIKLREQVIGEFNLNAPGETIRWSQDDVLLAEGVVNQVALAIENARLFEATQTALSTSSRLARRERLITEVTQKMTSGVDIQNVLQIAVDELRRGTNSSRAVVKLQIPTSTEEA